MNSLRTSLLMFVLYLPTICLIAASVCFCRWGHFTLSGWALGLGFSSMMLIPTIKNR